MTIRYLLPCGCGSQIPVDVSQAGGRVLCQCGATLDVPTMRQLGELERAEPETAETSAEWGIRQGVILLACVVTLVPGAIGGYLWAVQPAPPTLDTEAALRAIDQQIDALTPVESWELWHQRILADGLVQYDNPLQMAYHDRVATRQRWAKVALIIAGCGLAALVSTVLLAGDGGP